MNDVDRAAMELEKAEACLERWESLGDWLDRWEDDYADGQTRISREEAIRRWEQERKVELGIDQ